MWERSSTTSRGIPGFRLLIASWLRFPTFRYYTCFHDTLILVQVRTITVDNIEKILERGDKIELLVDKTATMQDRVHSTSGNNQR
ncbi:hypothetical protein SASPL_104715 [Salvia splendens]|uniref:V-SNARE coiled-coil homology domain-containing protein n=1 Tax=Salvia splendens TaxID=180675 RepID=A0A8X9A9B8_SALSN|nr:hypothetical protein SASPL_104715 [Salvia splendens]